ncbi:MAG: hypothetical protein ABSA32_16060, partial [Candidatus Acidiferrales bacterium]
YQRVFFGPVTQDRNRSLPDASLRERGLLFVMAAMILWMGIGSTGFTRRIEPSVTYMLNSMEHATPSYDAGAGPALPPVPEIGLPAAAHSAAPPAKPARRAGD